RGPVVEYYIRQKHNLWTPIPIELRQRETDEIKRRVKFVLYDHLGKITNEVNSLAVFKKTDEFNNFLKEVEAVCFLDDDYIFPDSKRFLDLVNAKGLYIARQQVINELKEQYKNKFYKRDNIF